MALQTQASGFMPVEAFTGIRNATAGTKSQAQNALTFMQTNNIDTNFVFRMLDQLAGLVNALTTWKAVAGLDTYATGQGYVGSLATDCNTCIAAAQTCITWVVTNFPKDASNTFITDMTLNADGSRTPRSFSNVQTTGLQTDLQAFIATIA